MSTEKKPTATVKASFISTKTEDTKVPAKKEEKKVEKKLYGHNAKNVMKTDVRETDAGYDIEIDLPGFTKDEVKASLENGYLTISAAKGLDKDEKEEKTGKYIR